MVEFNFVFSKMNKYIVHLLTAFLLTFLSGSLHANEWKKNSSGYKSAMQQSQKPKLIYFYADWCHACESVKRDVFGNTKVQEVLSNFVSVSIDVDQAENSNIVRKYMTTVYGNSGSYSIPEIFLVEAGGERIYRIPPVKRTTPASFSEYLNKFLDNKIQYAEKKRNNRVTRPEPARTQPISIQPFYGFMLLQFSWQPMSSKIQSGLKKTGSNAPKEVYAVDTGFLFFKRYGFGVELAIGMVYFAPYFGTYLDGGLVFNLLDLNGFQILFSNGIGTGPFALNSENIYMNYYVKGSMMVGQKLSLFTQARFYFDVQTVFDFANPYWSFGVGYAF